MISDSGHASGARMRDYRGVGDPASPKDALLVECGQHGEAAAARTAVDASLAFRESGILAEAFFEAHPAPDPAPQRFVQVTHAGRSRPGGSSSRSATPAWRRSSALAR